MTDFLTRLKQRKLVQWTIAYLAAGWVLLQVLGLLSDTYAWSPILLRLLPVAIAIGFFIVLILAWYHGERGLQRASSIEVALITAVLLGGAALTWLVGPSGASVASADPNPASSEQIVIRLAVLPFESVGRAEDAYIADAISDEIRGKLASVAGLEVIARASSNEYRETNKRAHQIARELRVNYLLSGTVRSQPAVAGQPARIRVSPELVQVGADQAAPVTRWQEPFDAVLTDIFEVQTDIAGRVAAGMDLALGASDRASMAQRPTSNPAAYEAYLKGVNWVGTGNPTENGAARHFERAVQLDPKFARAWAELASVNAVAQWFTDGGNANGEYGTRSREASEVAMKLSPDREGPFARGSYLQWAKADFKAAAEIYERALRQAPRDPRLLTGLCAAEQFLGRWAKAAEHCQLAFRIDPRNFGAVQRASVSLAAAGQHVAALKLIAPARELGLASNDEGMLVTAMGLEIRVRSYGGDVEGVRAALRRALDEGDAGERALSNSFHHAFWLYEPAQLRRLLTARDDAPLNFAVPTRAVAHFLLRDTSAARLAAAEARVAIEQRLRSLAPGSSSEAGRRMQLAIALAIQGQTRAAIREGERAARLMPLDADGLNGPTLHRNLAWLLLMAGDTKRALKVLVPILEQPSVVTPAAVRTDPRFAVLHGNPRFDALVAGK